MSARPYRAASSSRWILPLVAVTLLVAFRLWSSSHDVDSPPLRVSLPEGEFRVARVVDGDTLQLLSGDYVRLLGVDTPETVAPNQPVEPWGPEAAEFSRTFIGSEPVRLSYDKERQDRYGRHLAYAWRGETLLNEELIRNGFSVAITVFPYSRAMKDRFLAAQREAKKTARGIWSAPSDRALTEKCRPLTS
ncbi:MAG: thermonuclease family protein [Pirellulales bacterium]